MKITLVSILFLALFSSAAIAELTKEDLEEIRAIVKEEVGGVEERLNRRIDDFAVSARWMIGILALIIVGAFVLPQFLGRLERTELRELRERMVKIEAKIESLYLSK